MNNKDFNTRFLDFIKECNLINSGDKILAAVSGGCDSVVMCELLSRNKINFDIAHVNFKLRGKDSDEDEKFVKELTVKYDVKFHVTNFNTEEYASDNKISIEMAARELRYSWLNQLREKFTYSSIAIAHHQNDHVETILLNLVRGTGIRGLHGILPKVDNVIRPLLFSTRNDIEYYANKHKITYRIDKSNFDEKYQRNLIRQKVIPELKKLNPNIEKTFSDNTKHILEYEKLINEIIKDQSKSIVSEKDKNKYFDIEKLLNLSFSKVFLYEYLKDFGFNTDTVQDINQSLTNESGKRFYSKDYQLIKDRKTLILSKRRMSIHKEEFITQDTESIIYGNLSFEFTRLKYQDFSDLKEGNVAYLDYDKLSFPLKIRNWKAGDYFYPFGMTSKKKLSDYFIDEKISLIEKEDIPVLESGGEIAWVVGRRVDNRFGLGKYCKEVLKISMLYL